jgi:hypothetical protein
VTTEDTLSAGTVAELWAQARALGERADREGSPADLRRALVVLAVAGSGDDVGAYGGIVAALHRVAKRLGLDPVPLFDAASALVADPDVRAREALVTHPRRAAAAPRPQLG